MLTAAATNRLPQLSQSRDPNQINLPPNTQPQPQPQLGAGPRFAACLNSLGASSEMFVVAATCRAFFGAVAAPETH